MNRILVTGASGFIGSHLSRRLVADGREVFGVSRQPRRDDSLQWVSGDLSDADLASDVVDRVKPDAVVHLAAFVSGARELDVVLPSVRDTMLTGVNVLVAAARRGVPVLLAGSMEEPVEGEMATSPYAAAKQAVGSHARMLHAHHGLDVLTLRPFMVYGPGQEDYTKLIPYVIASFLRGEAPRVSSGRRPVDWVYVDDVVSAFVAALGSDSREWNAATFDVGSGELVTIHDLVVELAAMIDHDIEPIFGGVPDRTPEVVRTADVACAGAALGWAPRTGLRDGLRLTVDWYAENRPASAPSGVES